MIAKAKSISHGVNDIRYITGEAAKKKNPEKIIHVKNNLLDDDLDANGIWDTMKLAMADHPKVKNSVIRIELSPKKEYTKDFTIEDWKKLWDDFVEEFDQIEIGGKQDKQDKQGKQGRVISPHTNLKNSMATVWAHYDSKSGIPHLHAAVCRVDRFGHINNDHNIHERAIRAAERVARKRGWETARLRKDCNTNLIARECTSILKSMEHWDLDWYFAMLKKKYDVQLRIDKEGKRHGYSVRMGNSIYKASEIGTGRHFTIPNLAYTWHLLHIEDRKVAPQQQRTKPTYTQPARQSVGQSIAPRSKTPTEVQRPQVSPQVQQIIPQKPQTSPKYEYTIEREGTVGYNIFHNGQTLSYYIPKEVDSLFDEEFDASELRNYSDLLNLAASAFVGLLSTSEPHVGTGGGGSSDNLPWRDKDEDDLRWARRCAQYAADKLGKQAIRRYGIGR